MFPLTLVGLAHRWYTSLSPRSINSFEEIASGFTSYFATKVTHPEGFLRMVKIRQGTDETDEDYVDRVDEMVLTCEPASDEIALYSVLGGFNGSSPMFRYITKDIPPTYTIFRAKAVDFLATEVATLCLGDGATMERKRWIAW